MTEMVRFSFGRVVISHYDIEPWEHVAYLSGGKGGEPDHEPEDALRGQAIIWMDENAVSYHWEWETSVLWSERHSQDDMDISARYWVVMPKPAAALAVLFHPEVFVDYQVTIAQ